MYRVTVLYLLFKYENIEKSIIALRRRLCEAPKAVSFLSFRTILGGN